MGVEIEDAGRVAQLIGTKVFADELISFQNLVEMVCLQGIKVGHLTLTRLVGFMKATLRTRSYQISQNSAKNSAEVWRMQRI